ncbi:replication initiator protein [Microviridae sp.]|nr:replication initiator protein [Microviridae sp.]
MACYSPLKGYRDPETNGLCFKKTRPNQETLDVACGQCLGCRTDRALMWAVRIVHESTLHIDLYGNCFVTLTYRDQYDCTDEQLRNGYHIPPDGSLNKAHFQKFIKRLRRHFPQKIRFFHCGEYGDQTQRPHYHACLFNVNINDSIVWKNDEGLITYYSETLNDLWPYGFATVGELNYETAAYTARYILKKITGERANDHYLRCDDYGVAYWLQPEYVTMSLKPGIGYDYYQKYHRDIFPADKTAVPGKGMVNKVPRYYQNLLEASDTATLDLVKQLRQRFIEKHAEDFTPERLEARYRVHKARNKNHQRIAV